MNDYGRITVANPVLPPTRGRKHKGSASTSIPAPVSKAQSYAKRSLSMKGPAATAASPADVDITPPARPRSTATHRRQPASMSVPGRQDTRAAITPIIHLQQRDSVQASISSPGSNVQDEQGRRERNSGLGSAIRRLFGKRGDPKRKSASQQSQSSQQGHRTEDLYSDPGPRLPALRQDRSVIISPRTPSPQRAPAYATARLPYPMNLYRAPGSRRSSERDDIPSGQSLQRRATLPNLAQASETASSERDLHHRVGSDPVSAPPDVARFPDVTETIGLAITSQTAHHHRRSRSLGDLFRSAHVYGEEQAERRRSAEMELWRQSFTPSFMAKITRFIEERGGLASQSLRDSANLAGEDFEELVERSRVLTPFDFNDLHHGEVRATPVLEQSPIDLESETIPVIDQRLSLLESNMHDLTNSIQELTGRTYHPAKSQQTSPRIGLDQLEKTDIVHNDDHPPRMGLPANPRDTLAARMSLHYAQRMPSGSDLADQDQVNRKDSFLPSPNMEPISQAAIAAAFADAPSGVVRRTSRPGATSFSPKSLNLSPAKSSPHLRNTIVSDAAPASEDTPPIPSTLSPLSNLITTENIYTHLAPIYAALRYERQQRKDLESQVEILTKQVNDLATLLHRQSQQYAQQPIFRSPMSQQQNFSQKARSPNVGGTTGPNHTLQGLGLQPGYLTPRSEAASGGSIYASSGAGGPGSSSASESRTGSMITAPLAVMYPHYYHGQTQDSGGRPYHAPPAGYARYEDGSNFTLTKPPIPSRWSGYSERTQASSRFRSSVGTLGSEEVRELIDEDDEVEEMREAGCKDEGQGFIHGALPVDHPVVDKLPAMAGTPSTIRHVERISPPRSGQSQIPIPSSKNNSPSSKIPKLSQSTTTQRQDDLDSGMTSRSRAATLGESVPSSSAHLDVSSVEPKRLTQEGWVHAGNLTQFSPNPGAVADDDIF